MQIAHIQIQGTVLRFGPTEFVQIQDLPTEFNTKSWLVNDSAARVHSTSACSFLTLLELQWKLQTAKTGCNKILH